MVLEMQGELSWAAPIDELAVFFSEMMHSNLTISEQAKSIILAFAENGAAKGCCWRLHPQDTAGCNSISRIIC